MKTVRVVAAVIRQGDRIFATARGYGEFKGQWEFPGGKIEVGETPQQALIREIKEELDVMVSVGDLIDTIEHDYPTFHLSMDCFWCNVTEGEIKLKEAEDARWLSKDELYSVDWLPADMGLIEKLGGVFDTKERIARSNIYSIFGKFIRRQIDNNDDGEVLLKKAGLSAFWDDYKNKLSPYWYNRGYQNNNDDYNPEYVCLSICEKIESNEEGLLRFLNLILDGIHDIEDKQYNLLSNYLGVIGYELQIMIKEDYGYELKYYSLIPSTEGVQQRNTDISYLHSMLEMHHPDLVILYDEAITNFGSGQYVSCIENCRSLLENFFKKLDTINGDYVKGILAATGESIIDNGAQLTSIKKIYTYWIDNKRGANRFRLFQTMYSVMSGLGTHHEDVASKEDALLLYLDSLSFYSFCPFTIPQK